MWFVTVVNSAGEWIDAGRGLKHSHTFTHAHSHTLITLAHTHLEEKDAPKDARRSAAFSDILRFFFFSLNGRRQKKFPERETEAEERSVARSEQAKTSSPLFGFFFFRPGNYF